MFVVNILRTRQLEAATGGLSVVSLEVPSDVPGETRTVQASGLRTYGRNALTLGRRGEFALESELEGEIRAVYKA